MSTNKDVKVTVPHIIIIIVLTMEYKKGVQKGIQNIRESEVAHRVAIGLIEDGDPWGARES